jgi:hypothetical protein
LCADCIVQNQHIVQNRAKPFVVLRVFAAIVVSTQVVLQPMAGRLKRKSDRGRA